MVPEKRHTFVKGFRYPQFDFKGGRAGRITHLEQAGEDLRMRLDDGGSLTIPYELELAPGQPCGPILAAGDVVWVGDEAGSIRMLAPALKPFARRGFDESQSRRWNEFTSAIRAFFNDRDFIEARTPTLVSSPGLEPFLDPFETAFHFGRKGTPFFLPTSPEFHLKKMLALGWRRIFEFKECFRNGELSEHHQPEFLMLEWYRAYAGFETMIRDVRDLMSYMQEQFAGQKQFEKIDIQTVAGLFKMYTKFDLTPRTTREQIAAAARGLGITIAEDDSFDDIFARIFLEKIEGELGLADPVIVIGYPPSQAALARIGDDGWADRFELYWRGFELANAFHELNDPREQRRRFEKQIEEKRMLGKIPVPIDEEFMTALEHGLPPSVGIALGLERLFLAFMGEKDLKLARAFPLEQDRDGH